MNIRSVLSLKLSNFWSVIPVIGLIVAIAVISTPRPALTYHDCHTGTVYVAPAYVGPQVYGPAGVRGQARRVSRRTSRRVSRRR